MLVNRVTPKRDGPKPGEPRLHRRLKQSGDTRGKQAFLCALLILMLGLVFNSLQPVDSAAAQAADVGIKDFFFTHVPMAPTGQKPQSKLWFNDGLWWGVLYNRFSGFFEIYYLEWGSQTWFSTGTSVDFRPRSSADALWTGNQLFIASALSPSETVPVDTNVYVYKFSYDSASKMYTKETTSIIWDRIVETIVIDIDSTGTLWATFTDLDSNNVMNVYVTHTNASDSVWIDAYVLPVTDASNLLTDDISTLVAYNGNIGVLWSNQATGNINFSYHIDGTDDSASSWIYNPAVTGLPKYADDHLNIKSLQADPAGQLFAVAKTSLTGTTPPASNQPLILLLTLDGNGNWSRKTFGTVAENHTRPIILLDSQNRDLFIFATVQAADQFSGAIYYKHINLDDPGAQFASGSGDDFIVFSNDTHINNATSTKQALNGLTDLVVLASDDVSHYYFHNTIDLPDPPPGPVYEVFLPLILKN